MEEITKRKCLVTGATGVLGVPLVQLLLDRGHMVRALARRPISGDQFGGPVEVVEGDLCDSEAVERAVAGVDWIFHLAAKLHINDPGEEARGEYISVNVEGTRNLLAAAAARPVRKFVFFSTINVYGPAATNEYLTEASSLGPAGIYAETKVSGERLVLAAKNIAQQDIGIVLRLAAVYGSRMKGNYLRLAQAISKGRFVFVGKGLNRRTLVHQSDAAAAAVLAAECAKGGSIYNVTDGSVYTLREIADAVGDALGKKVTRIHLPIEPVRVGITAVETLARNLGIRPPVSRGLLDKFLEDIAVDGSKIQHELGFRPRFDLKQGWNDAVNGLNKK